MSNVTMKSELIKINFSKVKMEQILKKKKLISKNIFAILIALMKKKNLFTDKCHKYLQKI